MRHSNLYALLKRNPFFEELTDEQIGLILSIVEEKDVRKGEEIIREGEIGEDFYLIIAGKVAIEKREQSSNALHQLSILGAEEAIGEMALIDHSPRSASARALEDTHLLKISLTKLSSLADEKQVFTHIVLNICKKLSQRLRKTNDVTVKSLQLELEGAKARIEMGRFLFAVLILLALWIFTSTLAKQFSDTYKASSSIALPLILLLFIVCVIHVKRSVYSVSYFGLTLKNWKKNLLEGVIFTLPILALMTLGKGLLMHYHPDYQQEPLFKEEWIRSDSSVSPAMQLFFMLIYPLFVPFQEFIGRGVVQSSIYSSLTGRHSQSRSILLASLLFAAFHSYTTPLFCLIVFLCSGFWGWLYARSRSLISPSISHIIMGFWGLVVLDLSKFLKNY